MCFCGLPDAGTDGGENSALRTNWDANCMDAGTDGGENCVLGTNWDADFMDAGTDGDNSFAALMVGLPLMT